VDLNADGIGVMMESAGTLLGLGMPALMARKVGHLVTPLTGATTAQATGTAIPDSAGLVIATSASGQTALVLPATAAIGHEVTVYALTDATTALVFPEVGGTIDAGSTNASVNVAQVKARRFIKTASLTWISMLTA
jgi:hypothetical protein